MRKLIVYLASSIIVLTVVIVALIFTRTFRLPFVYIDILGANHSLTHWIGWIGALYIALATPLYPIVKRKSVTHIRSVLSLHIIGNLTAVLLVSVHFAHQVTRSIENYPDLGTGVVLYATMIILVATGFIQYSGLIRRYIRKVKFLHPAFALTFYTVIIMHIIHGI